MSYQRDRIAIGLSFESRPVCPIQCHRDIALWTGTCHTHVYLKYDSGFIQAKAFDIVQAVEYVRTLKKVLSDGVLTCTHTISSYV